MFRNYTPDRRVKKIKSRPVGLRMTTSHNQAGPGLELERSLPSEVAAISPFVDRLMLFDEEVRLCS